MKPAVATQRKSYEADTTETKTLKTTADAERLYLTAMQRLLDVNGWNSLSGTEHNKYQLLNHLGSPKYKAAEERDYIRFNFEKESPHHVDWVQIERIITKLNKQKRSISMTVRPVQARLTDHNSPPIYNSDQSISFIIQLDSNQVRAIIYQRDETNVDAKEESGLYSKIRNKILETLEHTGLRKKTEWMILTESLLKVE